jgi:hypothetical protein
MKKEKALDTRNKTKEDGDVLGPLLITLLILVLVFLTMPK